VNEVTLGELKRRALDAADMAGTAFPDQDSLTDHINDGLLWLHDKLVASDYLLSTSSITLVSGTEEYALPDDFYKSMRVWRISGGTRYEVDRFTLAQLSGHKTSGPGSSGTVELWYAPQLRKLKRDKDRVEVALPAGWESPVAKHAAIQLLIKEESDTTQLVAERDRDWARILEHIEPRDAGLPDSVEDHYGRWDTGLRDLEERSLRYRILGNKIRFVEFTDVGV
jgi:hypothetical protein